MGAKFDFKFWAGIGVSVIFMALLATKIDASKLAAAFAAVDYRYIAAAVGCTFLSYFMRAVRWRYLLIHEKTIPLGSLYPATIIGYMANNILPARLGEFIRTYVLARKEGLEFPTVFASLVIDRLFDGATVMLLLLYTLFALKLPQGMAEAEGMLKTGGLVSFALYAAILVFLLLLKRHTAITLSWTAKILRPFPRSLSERLIPLLGSFIGGISLSSRGRHIWSVVLSSLAVWLLCVIPVDLVLRGFGIYLPVSASVFILVLLVFAVMVPASPGFIGTYHYACFKGLSVFGIAEPQAVSIALVLHGTAFFPVILAGMYHLWRGRISLRTIRKGGTTP